MKKTLLFTALLIGGLSQLNAQCTIMPSCSTGTVGYCTTPATATPLPNASELTPYNTTIQVTIGTSAFGGAATISNATVTAVTGLPAGLSYSLNPSNGIINGGASGCLLITGTPSAGSAGSYTVTANITASTNFGPVPVSGTWPLTVTGSAGIKSYSNANMVIAPNPATSELTISADFHFGKIQIIDALGKIVISHDANYASQTIIDVHNLSKGVYFLQANDGKSVVTRKFIKD
ncbi:MAG: Secretion system C-terminal sorting domain [Bacteroidetes bacterium]|jgi:hypothetical protein|nr:Secretion system C-terminal sorting domain [Bacteroidota bacterium]MDF2450760.1 Secretion system C-terminal sorting domain [Bacteroidota bacterium]